MSEVNPIGGFFKILFALAIIFCLLWTAIMVPWVIIDAAADMKSYPFYDEKTIKDDSGNPVLDSSGTTQIEKVRGSNFRSSLVYTSIVTGLFIGAAAFGMVF